MEITEVRVRLTHGKDDQLKAFCSMTLDHEFVVRDIKVIQAEHGCFVAMPSRKLGDRCAKCGGKNFVGAKFCSGCGFRLPPDRVKKDPSGRPKLHADVAHPLTAECRKRIQEVLIGAYEEELKKSKLPGYKPAADDLSDNASDAIR